MCIFLEWKDIKIDSQRVKALKRFKKEVKLINRNLLGVTYTSELFNLKQALIRIYAANDNC